MRTRKFYVVARAMSWSSLQLINGITTVDKVMEEYNGEGFMIWFSNKQKAIKWCKEHGYFEGDLIEMEETVK